MSAFNRALYFKHMRVKFIKAHTGHKAGEYAEVKDSVANYLLKLRVVTIDTPTDEELEKGLTKKLKATKQKK